jgi:hypothetical protein
MLKKNVLLPTSKKIQHWCYPSPKCWRRPTAVPRKTRMLEQPVHIMPTKVLAATIHLTYTFRSLRGSSQQEKGDSSEDLSNGIILLFH